MITHLRWLALEVEDLEAAASFYVDHLGLPVVGEEGPAVSDRPDDADGGYGQYTFELGGPGGTALHLRRPTGRPRGGLHTHYALSVPAGEYDDWFERLSASFDVVEHSFGSVTSLYVYDPDGNCVELAGTDVEGPGIDGVFEVVLEVADLDRAVDLYSALGFAEVDREPDRVRLSGPVDLELWTPRLGIADGRGGVHVDLGFAAEDPAAVAEAVGDRVRRVERLDRGVRLWDRDGHAITVR